METNSLPAVDSLAAGRLAAFLNVRTGMLSNEMDRLQATPAGESTSGQAVHKVRDRVLYAAARLGLGFSGGASLAFSPNLMETNSLPAVDSLTAGRLAAFLDVRDRYSVQRNGRATSHTCGGIN
jgi:hypothetical protein